MYFVTRTIPPLFERLIVLNLRRLGRSSAWIVCASVFPQFLTLFCIIIMLEWFTMTATQGSKAMLGSGESHWKEMVSDRDPWIIRRYFSHNFKNLVGITGICGLFFSPIYLYATHVYPSAFHRFPECHWIGYWFMIGQGLSMLIQLYFILRYFAWIAERDGKMHVQ